MSTPESSRHLDSAYTEASDTELITLLRDGDVSAYAALWCRHIEAALRVARRIAPDQAEDLASESFLAVYQQIAVKRGGPDSAFRAYLFTSMRNLALTWQRDGRQVDLSPEVDEVRDEDGLTTLEEKAVVGQLLSAFQSLPERWQQVLWLSEVEEMPRPAIARVLHIKPNAVSALHRRAKAGLRVRWMDAQIPPALRGNATHVADRLPQLLTSRRAAVLPRDVSAHLRWCESCRVLHAQLTDSQQQLRSGSLAVFGFAALGVVVPAASTTALTAAGAGGAALVIGGLGVGGTLVAAGAATLLLGGVLLGGPAGVSEASETSRTTQGSGARDGSARDTGSPQPGTGRESGPSDGVASNGGSEPLGRGNDDQSVSTFATNLGAEPTWFWERPAPPAPVDPGGVTPPNPVPDAALRVGLVTPTSVASTIAPVLTGVSSPGAQVVVEVDRSGGDRPVQFSVNSYLVEADESGAWSFDLRALAIEAAGTYRYQLWAVAGTETSPVVAGSFDLTAPTVTGFEVLAPFETLPLAEASTTGIVFEVRGAPHGTICLTSVYSGQRALIPLSASGTAVRRIQFLSGGTYSLEFRSCDGDFRGPDDGWFVDVEDPDAPMFGPFGPDPADTVFELSAVA